MSRVLLDENVPAGLRRHLEPHDVLHATQMGWDGLANGLLIAAAEREGFQVLVTADRNLLYQQNLDGREIALVVLGTNHWDTIRSKPELVGQAIERASPGGFEDVAFPPA